MPLSVPVTSEAPVYSLPVPQTSGSPVTIHRRTSSPMPHHGHPEQPGPQVSQTMPLSIPMTPDGPIYSPPFPQPSDTPANSHHTTHSLTVRQTPDTPIVIHRRTSSPMPNRGAVYSLPFPQPSDAPAHPHHINHRRHTSTSLLLPSRRHPGSTLKSQSMPHSSDAPVLSLPVPKTDVPVLSLPVPQCQPASLHSTSTMPSPPWSGHLVCY